jgi:hypothetical protein
VCIEVIAKSIGAAAPGISLLAYFYLKGQHQTEPLSRLIYCRRASRLSIVCYSKDVSPSWGQDLVGIGSILWITRRICQMVLDVAHLSSC